MDQRARRLADLHDAADNAYQRARSEVYDVLGSEDSIKGADLTIEQRAVLEALERAEAELAAFRESRATVDLNANDSTPLDLDAKRSDRVRSKDHDSLK